MHRGHLGRNPIWGKLRDPGRSISLILGIVAIFDLRKHPEKHGWGRAIFGLVMGLIFSLGLLVMLLVGAFAGRR